MRIVSFFKTIFSALTAPRTEELPDHLLRDIGLPERGPRTLHLERRFPIYNG